MELKQATAADVPELGRILYEAFRDIAQTHGFEPDFPSVEFATAVCGLLVAREDVYSASVHDGGRPRASTHVNYWGDVAGIGPVSVDIDAQGGGYGRAMMLDSIDHSVGTGYEMIRLMQDSFNMRSLALYASVGFVVREPYAEMDLSSQGEKDAAFRVATPADYVHMDELCRSVYGVSRFGEYEAMAASSIPIYVLDRGGIVAYKIATGFGHGVARSDDEMLTLLASVGAHAPAEHAYVPIRSGDLYRAMLAAGHRNRKIMNMMSYGPYEPPSGTHVASAMF